MGIRKKITLVEQTEKLAYQKTKVKWYQEENARLVYESARVEPKIRRLERQIASNDKLITKLKEQLLATRQQSKMRKYFSGVKTKEKKAIINELVTFQKEIQHLSKDLDWDKNSSKQQHLEVIIRTLITYNKLITKGILTFNEFAFLLIGSQKQFFTVDDLLDRYGDLGYYVNNDIKLCIEAGLLKKVERKRCWYITILGKKRLNDILKCIYTEKVNTYRILKKSALEEIPDEG